MTTQNKDNLFLRAALRYAEIGFRVFPVKPKGKEPLVKDWPNQATNDRNIIQEWWSKHPNANIAIVTGYYEHGYFCVLDFDPRNGGGWYGDVDESVLPPTCVAATGGGGRHYYYRTNEPIPTKKLKGGVDLKGAGGYVIVPPSLHPNGSDYQWLVGEELWTVPMADLPDWAFFEAVGGDETKGLWRMNPPIPEGTRHNYIVSLAGVLWNADIEIDEIEKIIRDVIKHFQTTEGFDAEREIANLVRDLPKWHKFPKPLSLLLNGLPEEVRNIVIRNSKKVQDILYNKINKTQKTAGTNTTRDPKGTENSKRSARSVKFQKIVDILLKEELVLWNNRVYIATKGRIIDIDNIMGFISSRLGREKISQEDIAGAIAIVREEKGIKHFDGFLLPDEKLVYGVVDGIEGLWGHYDKTIYCYPVRGPRLMVWPLEEAPAGVYKKDGPIGLPIIPQKILDKGVKNIETLIDYFYLVADRAVYSPEVILSMLAPTFFGLGHAGFMFVGEPSSGKSTFATAMGYLEKGSAWRSPGGQNTRDYIASLAGHHKITYFDEVDYIVKELLPLIKAKITGNEIEVRKLFNDEELVVLKMKGSVIISTTGIKEFLKGDFLDRMFFIRFENKPGAGGAELMKDIEDMYLSARAGLIELFRKVAKKKPPEKVPVSVRFADWYKWGYRFAQTLLVEEEFERTVKYSKLEAMRNSDFNFLVDFFREENIIEGHPYKIGEIFTKINGPSATTSSELRRLYGLLGRKSNAENEISAIAKAAGYKVRLEKQVVDKEKGKKVYVLVFNSVPEVSYEETKGKTQEKADKSKQKRAHLFKEDAEEEDTQRINADTEENSVETEASQIVLSTPEIEEKKTNHNDDDDDDPEGSPPPAGDDDDDGGNDNGGGGDGAPSDEYYECEEEEIQEEYTDPWDDVDYKAQQGQAAVNEDPPASAIIYEGEKLSMDDVKRYVKLFLMNFLEDPQNKKDEVIQKLTEYITIVNEKLKEEDLQTAMQYIQSQINTIKMIALLNGKKIDFAEPYIPPSPKEVPVKAQPAPAPAPPAPPPPKPPAPPITNQHSVKSQPAPAPAPPAPPKPPPTAPPIQNQVSPPVPPTPPPEPPPKPASPRLNYETDDDFLGFMYAQMKNIRRNGGKDDEVAAFLLGLREEVSDYLRQKGLNHALFILEATLKSFFVAKRV